MFWKRLKGTALLTMLCCAASMACQGNVMADGAESGQTESASLSGQEADKASRINLGQLYPFSMTDNRGLYTFKTSAARACYQVKALLPEGNSCRIEIYNEAERSMVCQAELANGEFERFVLEPSAEYYMKVSGEAGMTGEIIVSEIADDYGDTIEGAAKISFNKEYSVVTEYSDDVDILKITTDDKDTTYTLTIDPASGTAGVYDILDEEGNPLEGHNGSTDGETKTAVKLALEQKKTYYIKISSTEKCRQVVVSVQQKTNTYKITYHLNGGKNHKDNKATYTATQSIVLKDPTAKGSIFEGWYTKSDFSSKITTVKGSSKCNYDLYAKWKKIALGKVSVTSFTSSSPGKAKLVFGAVSGAKGYQVSITRKKNGKVKNEMVTKTTMTYTELVQGDKYEVTIRAYAVDSCGNRIYGDYSKVKSVTVKKKAEKKTKKKDKKK